MRSVVLLLISFFSISLFSQTDTVPPVITLLGANPLVICNGLNKPIVDPGAYATDNYDPVIIITINNSLLNNQSYGTYSISYDATDKSGNKAKTVIRIVKLVPNCIYGSGYYDDNKNCLKDSGEALHTNYKVVFRHLSTLHTTTYYSDIYGSFVFDSLPDTGNYTVYVYSLSPSAKIACGKDSFPYYHNNSSSLVLQIPFLDSVKANLSCYINHPPVCRYGFPDSIRLYVVNTSNTPLTHVQCKLIRPAGIGYISYAYVTLDSTRLGSMYWHIDTLPAHSNLVFKFPFSADTSIHLNDTITWRFYVKADQTETDTSDNRDVLNMRVVGSYDPNMKTCSQPAVVPAGASTFTYRVDFQNTGTADAINVSVTDTLDPKFDISSLRIKSASHPYELIIRNNILIMKFYFIYLPDSHTNEPGSHGYFTYTLNLKKPLAVTEVVRNTAYIYFDNNAPIVTNTVINQYAKTGIKKTLINTLDVYPNPAQTRVYFPNDNLEKAELMDITGHILMQTGSNIFDISALPSGLYFIRVGNRTAKLIKE